MNIDEAVRIAQLMEDDQVIEPVGLALRTLFEDYKEIQAAYYQYSGFKWRTF